MTDPIKEFAKGWWDKVYENVFPPEGRVATGKALVTNLVTVPRCAGRNKSGTQCRALRSSWAEEKGLSIRIDGEDLWLCRRHRVEL